MTRVAVVLLLAALVSVANGQTIVSPVAGYINCSGSSMTFQWSLPTTIVAGSMHFTFTPTTGFATGTTYKLSLPNNGANAGRVQSLSSIPGPAFPSPFLVEPAGATSIPNNNYTVSATYIPSGGTEDNRTAVSNSVAPVLVMYQSSVNPNITSPVAGVVYGGTAGIPVIFNTNRVLQSGNISLNGQTQALSTDRLLHDFNVSTANALHPTSSGNYTLNVTYIDGCDNTTVLTGSVVVTLDMETLAPTLIRPLSHDDPVFSPISANVTYSIPEAPLPSSVQLVFDSPELTVVYQLNDTYDEPVTVLEDFLFDEPSACSPCFTAGSSGSYDVSVRYQDYLGNAVNSTVALDVPVDVDTEVPTLLFPATGHVAFDQFNISYSLFELASVIELWIIGQNNADTTQTLVLTLNSSLLTASFVFNNSALTASPSGVVIHVNGTSLSTACYSVQLRYQDVYSNPVASSVAALVTLVTTPETCEARPDVPACEECPTCEDPPACENCTVCEEPPACDNCTVCVDPPAAVARETDWTIMGPVVGIMGGLTLLFLGWWAWQLCRPTGMYTRVL